MATPLIGRDRVEQVVLIVADHRQRVSRVLTWRNTSHELDRMRLVTLATPDGQVAQRSATTPGQKAILAALELLEPARFFDFNLPSPD